MWMHARPVMPAKAAANPHETVLAPAVVLFDGYCHLCSRAVRFIVKRDPRACFRFAALQSQLGKALLAARGLAPGSAESFVLIERQDTCFKSTAALRIARELRWPWRWLYALVLIPRPARDRLYDWVGARRYRWFGRRASCLVPGPDIASRFIADGGAGTEERS